MTVSELEIKIGADLAELRADLRKMDGILRQSADKADGSFKGAFKNIGGYIAGAFAVESIRQFGSEVVRLTAEFEKFEAVLTNTLGSKSGAQEVMKQIEEFAAKTPFSVQELTDSFVRLTNQGLMPSEEALRRYGDLAASTGKDFNQLAEAVIDATTGEFERLKEFGIRASSEGNRVAFTFKGVTTEVDKTSKSIEEYILSLGDLQGVSGSMNAIAKTTAGSISNLGDEWTQLLVTIGDAAPIQAATGHLINLVKAVRLALTQSLSEAEQFAKDLPALVQDGFLDVESAQVGDFNPLKLLLFEADGKTLRSEKDLIKAFERNQTTLQQFYREAIALQKKSVEELLQGAGAGAGGGASDLEKLIAAWQKGVPAIDHAADAAELFKKHIYEGLTAMERFKFEEFEKMREDAALLGQLVPTGAGQQAIGMEAEDGMFLDAQGREFGTEGEAQTQAMIDQFEQLRLQSFLSREDIILTGMATDAFASSFGDAMEGALLNGENFVESLGQNLRQLIVNMARAVAQALILKAVLSTIPGIGQIAGIGSVISGGLNFSSAIRGSDIITVSQRASSNQSRGGN